MCVSRNHEKLVEAFKPTVAWSKVEATIAVRSDPTTLAGASLPGLAHRSIYNLKTAGTPKMMRLASRVESVQTLGSGLLELVSTSAGVDPKRLRLPDLLFSELDASPTELARRRTRLWELFLRPMTRHVCTSRKVSPPY